MKYNVNKLPLAVTFTRNTRNNMASQYDNYKTGNPQATLQVNSDCFNSVLNLPNNLFDISYYLLSLRMIAGPFSE